MGSCSCGTNTCFWPLCIGVDVPRQYGLFYLCTLEHWSPWTVWGKGNSTELCFLSPPLLCLSFSSKLFCKQLLTQPGYGMAFVHGCSELHAATWSGCRCLSSLQHQPKDASASSRVICSSPAAVSPFGLRTFAWAPAQICCSSKGQRQHSVRKSCIFQAVLGKFVPDGPVCWSHLFLTHARHIIQVSSFLTLFSVLPCWSTCYFQMRSHIPPSFSYHSWACSFH